MASIGDIVFLGYNGVGNPEGFSFVVKNALPANDIIKFTDNAINTAAANVFRTGEYAIQWNVPAAGVAAGTVVVITNWGSTSAISFNDSSGGSITSLAIVGELNVAIDLQTNPGLSNSGDQIFAYTGTLGSPTILAGLNASTSPITTGSPGSNNTYAPLAGVPFTNLGGVINGKTIFTTNPGAQSIANLTNPANFTTQNPGIYTLTDITSAPPISTVNLSVSSNSGTEAAQTAITVTATASSAVSGNQTVNLAVTGTGITTGDYTLSGTTITILNGQTTGTATFTVVDDASVEGTETATLTINNPSAGMTLGTTTTQNVAITDNDSPGVTITESAGNTNVTEGGATDSYTVVLNTQPTADVTIAINSGTQTTTNTNSLTFTTANWNTAQTVTVTAVDDVTAEGNHTQAISHTATSSDSNYSGITINSVTANITDNDAFNTPPTISENTTTPFVNLPATGPGYVSGAINDPTDPAKSLGIDFTVADAETANPTLSILSSSNTTVVPLANVTLTNKSGNNYNVKINPASVGYSNITVRVTDGDNATADYIVNYAASAASVNPSTTRFLTGASDASTAIAIDSNYMLVADDEDQKLRLYDRQNSGFPLNSFDFTSSLGLTQLSGGIPREVDIEASTKIGNRIYWLGSQSNSSGGSSRPNRYRLFATDISGTAANTTLNYVGRYDNLRTDLIAWGDANGYGFSNSVAIGVIPEAADGSGFNIEGLTIAPNGTTGYVAFRAPEVPTATRQKALIAPITNFTDLVTGAATTANIGAPIELDLGGRGIRSIDRNANNEYLIVAGPPDAATGTAPKDFRLYSWTGNASDTPKLLLTDLTGLNADGSFESIVEVPSSLTSGTEVQLLVDNGDSIFYNDGTIAKDLTQDNFQKFRSEIVKIAAIAKIHEIQGSSSTFNPTFSGTQAIEGIVTRAFQGSTKLNGFYVQEEDADADSDPTTSEAIFVYDPTGKFTGNVGDKVQVTGTVSEYTSGSTGSSLTQISSLTNVTNLGSSTLPTVTNIQLPVTNVSDLENYEGMLVNLSATSGELTVTENFQLGRYGQVVLSATGASNQTGTDSRLDQYTQFNNPSVSGYSAYLNEIAKRKIYLDDGSGTQNLDPILFGRGGNPLSASNTLRGGDTVANITGILDQRFEGYRLQTTTGVNFNPTNPRPNTPPDVGSNATLKVASANVLNFFNGDGTGGGFPTARGANNLNELNRQRAKIVQEIANSGADVVGLMELENDGYSSNSAIQDLVNELNAVAGAGTYNFINPVNSLGTDQIVVGMIYKPGKVKPVGAAATMPDGYGSGAFDLVERKPLAQTFEQVSNSEKFTAVINHFKSKGSSAGGVGDADAGDGQGFSNGTRTRQAQDLATWLATNPTGNNDPDYLILGDLNAYTKEDPITSLASAGYENLLPITSYSYVFDGQVGSLDHALASTTLKTQVTGAEKWHINADEPTVLDYNTEFKSTNQQTSLYSSEPFRASDHDPVIVGLNLQPPKVTIEAIDGNAAEAGSDVGMFRITRSGGSLIRSLNVNYAIATGTGTATENDYTPVLNGTVIIPADESFVELKITPADDSLAEGNETLTLNLVDTTDYDLGTANTATVTIADNDAVGVSISKTTASVAEDGNTDNYNVVLKSQPTAPVNVDVNPANNQISLGTGAGNSIVLEFNPNNWNIPQTVTVTAVDDTVTEESHTSSISHVASSSDSNYNISTANLGNVAVNITDNDVNTVPLPLALNLTVNPNSFSEAAGANATTGTVTRNGDTSSALTVNLASNDTTEAIVASTVTIPAGQTNANFAVATVDDTIFDGVQTVTLTATAKDFTDSSAPVKVTDNDTDNNEQASLTLTVNPNSFSEAAGANAATGTVKRSGSIASPLTVNLSSSDVTEATTPQTVEIPIGQESVNFSVTAVDDLIADGTQPVKLTASAPNFTSGLSELQVTDNDSPSLEVDCDRAFIFEPSIDSITNGNNGNEAIFGNQSVDIIDGKNGNDIIFGGKNNDSLHGNFGDDILFGNQGDDYMGGGKDLDLLFGGKGNDQLFGSQGNDELHGNLGDDQLYGGEADDKVYGSQGNDSLCGGPGDDILYGGKDSDYVQGGLGNDLLYGDENNDTLIGGTGNDVLSGGKGKDEFLYTILGQGVDIITDFFTGDSDILNLKAVLDSLSYKGTNPINDGYVKLSQVGSYTLIEIDPDGAIGGQLPIELARLNNLVATSLNSNNFRF